MISSPTKQAGRTGNRALCRSDEAAPAGRNRRLQPASRGPRQEAKGGKRIAEKFASMKLPFVAGHAVNFLKRVFYNYFLRDFQIASIEWILGPILALFLVNLVGFAMASRGRSGPPGDWFRG